MSALQPRMTQEQRSALTKDKLARAAFEVIHDVGYAGFRTAAVAKAAGVSQGGQLHHFPTKDDLALAAVEYCNALAPVRPKRISRASAADAEPIEAISPASMDYYFSEAFDVAIDVVKSSSQNAELRRVIADSISADKQPLKDPPGSCPGRRCQRLGLDAAVDKILARSMGSSEISASAMAF